MLDSDVLLAIFNRQDVHHETIVKRLFAEPSKKAAISAITLSEALVHSYRSGFGEAARAVILGFVSEVFAVNEAIAVKAAELRATKNLKTPDALIAATALLEERALLTFDRKLADLVPGSELLSSA